VVLYRKGMLKPIFIWWVGSSPWGYYEASG